MVIRGIVQNGVVVLPEDVAIPEGTTVSITVSPDGLTPPQSMGLGQQMAALAQWSDQLPTDLPVDLAAQHDHYLHGTPRT